jgi:lysophospholipase L1-like esterase
MLELSDGTVLSSAITPQVGSVDLIPVNSPEIDEVGIGGRSAIWLPQSSLAHLTAHALSSLVSGDDKPLTVIARTKRDYPTGQRSVFGFGNSAQSANDFLYGAFPAGAGNSPTFVKDAVAETQKAITRTGSLDYTDHVVAFVTNGTTGWIYLDGAEVATDDLDTLGITPNRFVVGGRHTTAVLEHMGGWISHFAMTGQALSPTQIQTVTTAWRAGDLGYPGQGTAIQFFGDSITQGDSDNDPAINNATRGGFRYNLFEWARANRLRLNMVGHRTQGIFADPEHSSIGGATTGLIRDYVDTYVPQYDPRAVFVLAGTNDSDAIEGESMTLAAWRVIYEDLLDKARTHLDAVPGQSDGRIIVATITPIETGTAGATAIGDMNTELVDIWDDHDAANSTKPALIRCDFHTAIGAWHANNFKDAVHPNHTGYSLLGDELIAQAGSYLESIAT